MSQIVIYDPYAKKFTQDMIEHWERRGHTVRYSNYYNPQLIVDHPTDVIWFDTCDNNLASATNPGAAILEDEANFQPWDLHDMDLTGKKVIVRAIDIEVWQGHFMASLWDKVTNLIFIAPHIRNLVDQYSLPGYNPDMQINTIPCGINLSRYRYDERQPGFDIAVVSERWVSKGTDLVLQVAYKLKQIDPRYKIHWLGQWGGQGQWEQFYFDDFIKHNSLNIEVTNVLNDGRTVDDFLEGKNYLLHGSKKEGFSYATGEAMAKGIKPVIHRFYGADELWPGITWTSIDEAVEMITEDKYNSADYRKYLIERGYYLDHMMDQFEQIIK